MAAVDIASTEKRGSFFAPRKFSLTNPEKNSVELVEEVRQLDTAEEAELDHIANQFTDAEKKKLMWRIDRRLVLTLGFMYCVSLMDRTNLGIAVVAGMGVDLTFIGARYSIIVLVFFITYVLFQPPATVVLRKLGPRAFLPAITILWGCTMIGFGFVRDWTQLIPLRLLLGIFEAGFFPGCAYLLSCWYPRYELQKRNAVFYLIGSMASAFAGILAYGLSQMGGLGTGPADWGLLHVPGKTGPQFKPYRDHGIAGWRWIFIMEGVITCALGIAGYFLIVDFPESAAVKGVGLKFITEKEAAWVVARIEQDRHDAIPERFTVGGYLKNALDLKVWGFACLFGLTTTNTYAIAYFLPIILKDGMGFNTAASQCMVAPPYVMAAIVMYAMAWAGDKLHIRSPFILINGLLLLIGIPLLGFSKNVGARYFGVFLATTACNANVPCVLTWQANNIRGQWKRALCSATLVGFGGIGGIIGSTVFRSQDSPAYLPGMYTCMISGALIIIITLAMNLKFYRANKRADAGGKPIEKLEGFRYTY